MATESDARVEAARKRVRQLRAFYQHLAAFVILIVAMFFIDLFTGDSWWVQWAAIG